MTESSSVRCSPVKGFSLQRVFYTDDDVYRADVDRLFRRYWVFAGFLCEIPRVGDYMTFEIDNESIVVVRSAGGLRAFYNVCRHRGTRICDGPLGHVRSFVCPYHQWRYGLDGALIAAPNMDDEIDFSQHPLHAARIECVEGLVFVSLSQNPPPFEPLRQDFERVLRPHQLANTRVAHTERWIVPANWKLVVENQRECYHCAANHKEYIRAYYDTLIDNPAFHSEMELRLEEATNRWMAIGIDCSTANMSSAYTGPWYRANRTPFRMGYVTESLDGQPVAPLLGQLSDPDIGTGRCNTYLNFWLHAMSDHAAVFRLIPLAAESTEVRLSWLVRSTAQAGKDYDTARLTAFTLTQWREDLEILHRQAAGVRSAMYTPGPYSLRKEDNTLRFISWYLETMAQDGGFESALDNGGH